MRCRIGITCGWRESEQRHLLHEEYVRAIAGSGGIPVLLPAAPPELAESYYQIVDGLLFSGGDDIDPGYFGEEPVAALGEITPKRDAFELRLAELAWRGKKPVLGICRGIQLLNVALGGTLHQDIGHLTVLMHNQKAPRTHAVHQVDVAAGSCLGKILGTKTLRVNSYHHQAVNQIAQGLQVTAHSKDGLVEALEAEGEAFFLGVQWHPECTYLVDAASRKLFAAFVEEVSASRIKG
ncbi:MAG: gamma-glutamyl-gamma-aminobutyrate hydrolase family protein [Clostridia bacterium]|jgi:putative glutamine amidotransferase|nr:gamma-glutamyl-gamma-aminobutyrate hydrolase family protein [Clostridia bacterium]